MDDVTRYEWDHRNRLTAVREYADAATEPMAELLWSVEYTYDSLDRQIRKTVDGDGDGTIDDFFYSVHVGDELQLEITDPDGLADDTTDPLLERRHLYGPATDQILAVDDGTDVLWALSDHQGTVRDVIELDGTVQVVDHRTYDSFGNLQQPVYATDPADPVVRFPFTYTGRLLDPHTLLHNYRARWYDAAVGRFVNEDPAGLSADANLYRYAANSPMIYVDPSGLGYNGFDTAFGKYTGFDLGTEGIIHYTPYGGVADIEPWAVIDQRVQQSREVIVHAPGAIFGETDLDMIADFGDYMHYVVRQAKTDHDSAGTRCRDDSGSSSLREVAAT